MKVRTLLLRQGKCQLGVTSVSRRIGVAVNWTVVRHLRHGLMAYTTSHDKQRGIGRMGIRHLACWKPYDHDAATTACSSPPASGLPAIDLMRANPAGYLLSRMLAPGSTCKPTAAWVTPSVSQPLMLGHGVHCETRCGSASAAGKRCIVLFHGNSADSASTLDQFAGLRAYGDLIAVNAPGYGETPPPNNHRQLEWQMASNVQAVMQHVAQSYAPQDILWLGFSLGSAQAAVGFQSMPGSHLLLDAPFTSVRALVDKHIGAVIGA